MGWRGAWRMVWWMAVVVCAVAAQRQVKRLYDQATASYDAGRFDDAIVQFARAKEEAGGLAVEMDLNIGQCLYHLGRVQDAEDQFVATVEQYRSNPKALLGACRFYSQQGRRDKAAYYCREYERMDTNARMCSSLYKSCDFGAKLRYCHGDTRKYGTYKDAQALSSVLFVKNDMKGSIKASKLAWRRYLDQHLQHRLGCPEPMRLHYGWMVKGHESVDTASPTTAGSTLLHHRVLYTSADDQRSTPRRHYCFAPSPPSAFPQHQLRPHYHRMADASFGRETQPQQAVLDVGECGVTFDVFVLQLEDAYMEIPGVVHTQCDVYLGSHHVHEHVPMIRPSRVEELPPSTYMLLTYKLTNYYHWMVEMVPRLLVLEQRVLSRDPNYRLYVPNVPLVFEFLDMMGIPRDRIDTYEGDDVATRYHAANLTYVEYEVHQQAYKRHDMYASMYGPPELLRQAKQRFGGSDVPGGDCTKIVYVSREDGYEKNRIVLEEHRVTDRLRRTVASFNAATGTQLELVPLVIGNMSIADQIDLFKQTIAVIGPHGAGLTNMLWMAPGSVVVEFPIRPSYANCFHYLSRVLGHRYWVVPEMHACYYGSYETTEARLDRIDKTLHTALLDYHGVPHDEL